MATITLFPSVITTVRTWSNPNNAKLDDNKYASTSGWPNYDFDIIGTGFDLSSIPSGSTINSISIEVEYYLSTSGGWTGTLTTTRNGTVEDGVATTTSAMPTSPTVWTNSSVGTWSLSDLANLGVLFRVRKTASTWTSWYVDYLAVNVDYTPPGASAPTITISSTDKLKISGVTGFTRSNVQFSSDQALSEWEARATKNGVTPARGVGLLVGSGLAASANTPVSFEVDDIELTQGDGEYTVTVYGKSTGGVWSG